MKPIDYETIQAFLAPRMVEFHRRRADSLLTLKLNDVLKRKNPYLFKAKNINTAAGLIESVLAAYLSSKEETVFGNLLEELAIFICAGAFNGIKSSAEGIDLEFERDHIRYIIAVKSGPNWGNSSQIARMRDNFKRAKKVLGANLSIINIVAVNGCCYGKEEQIDKGDYLKYCGQKFWEFISGDEMLYLRIIEPLGYRARENNKLFDDEYAKVKNKFTLQFAQTFCREDGGIDWDKLVIFNSQSKQKRT